MDKNWSEDLRKKMSGYTENEPEGLLQDILSKADLTPDIPKQAISNKTLSSAVLFRTAIISTAAAIVLSVVIWNKSDIHTAQNNITTAEIVNIVENTSESGQEEKYIASLTNNSTGIKTGKFDQPGKIQNKTTQENPEKSVKDIISSKTENHGYAPSDISVADDYTKRQEKSVKNWKKEDEDPIEKAEKKYGTFNDLETDDFDNTGKMKKVKRFSTDIFYSNLTGSGKNLGGYSAMRQSDAASFNGIPVREYVSGTPGEGAILLTSGENSSTTTKHRQPVRAGVSFRYNFHRRWGIETGLSYSLLSSKMESSESRYKSSTLQRLHYIGIPLKINWSFIDKEHFSAYLNAGGMMEKCISGKVSSDYSIDGNPISHSEDKINIKPLQWSVNAGAGIQWKITSGIGIYAEPGISYHFDDGSPISTVYKERPLNFNIEFGIRLSFE